jgi:hypothetical protein
VAAYRLSAQAGNSLSERKLGPDVRTHLAPLGTRQEIVPIRIRVGTAMATQIREQGSYLGCRPPYTYQHADAGPQPNKAHAAWGRRAHRLE